MRWTDLATWVGPTVNQSGAMAEVRGLVLHTAEGYYNGTISWQKNPDANVSSHFIVSGARDAQYGVADGKLAQMVDTDITAWTQRAGNGHWLSLECSGFGSRGDRLSAGQLEAAAQLLARAHTAYGVPLRVASNPTERGLGHHSMDREGIDPEWGHDDCPGANIIAQKPLIVVRAIEITEGADMDNVEKALLFNASSISASEARMSDSAPTKKLDGSYADGAPLPMTSVIVMKQLAADVAEVKVNLAAVLGKDWTDEQAIVDGVLAGLAGLTADAIAERLATALPAELAADVVAALGAKLTG